MINIGIDVHKKKCHATIKGDTREILEQTVFNNTLQGIRNFAGVVKDRYGGARAVCESTANYWIMLHDTLEDEFGIDTLLAHPAKTKVIAQAKLKNDKVDSEVLADLLRTDMVYESFVPNKKYRQLRNLVRSRLTEVRKVTRYKNTAHAVLAKYDYKCPYRDVFSQGGMQWLDQIEVSEVDRMILDMCKDEIAIAQKHILAFESKIAAISSKDLRTRLLMTIPGIGYVTALTVIAEVVDIDRFGSLEKLVSYAGIAPSQRSSGETTKLGRITKQGSRWLRNATVEAANSAIQHDQRLGDVHKRISHRRGPQKAKVAVAREMLVISWCMLTRMEPYRTQNAELAQRKYKAMERVARTA